MNDQLLNKFLILVLFSLYFIFHLLKVFLSVLCHFVVSYSLLIFSNLFFSFLTRISIVVYLIIPVPKVFVGLFLLFLRMTDLLLYLVSIGCYICENIEGLVLRPRIDTFLQIEFSLLLPGTFRKKLSPVQGYLHTAQFKPCDSFEHW